MVPALIADHDGRDHPDAVAQGAPRIAQDFNGFNLNRRLRGPQFRQTPVCGMAAVSERGFEVGDVGSFHQAIL